MFERAHVLEIFDLTEEEEQVYLALLELPPVTVTEARRACSTLTRAQVRAAIDRLTDRGLLTQLIRPPRHYTPVAPDVSLEAHLLTQEERLREARTAIAELNRRFRTVPGRSGGHEFIEVVTGRRRVTDRMNSALRGARRKVCTMDRPPFTQTSPEPNQVELEMLGRGVAFRAVYDQSGVRCDTIVERRRAEIAAGEQARMVGEVPIRLILVDDRLALLPLRHDRQITEGLVVVYPSTLRTALAALFEVVWQQGLPFTLGRDTPAPTPDQLVLGETTRAVLSLLSAGLNDQAIAHRLGCSDRTVQRHVRLICEAVGAKSRFQAALQLGRRGWIS